MNPSSTTDWASSDLYLQTHARRPTPVRHNIDLEIPGVQGAQIAVRCFAPDPAAARRLPDSLWVFALPGSSGDWSYFDLEFPGREHEGYSFAAYLAARGVGLVAIDTLGTGDSVFPSDGAALTLELLAFANHQAVTEVRARLAAGTLHPEVEPLGELMLCGVGHSGGGGTSIVQQAEHNSFDLLAVLGMASDDMEIHGGHDGVRAEFSIDANGMLFRDSPATAARARGYLNDVPDDVISGRTIRPFPQSYPSVMRRGTLLPYAQKITCPVLVAIGEVDYVGSPFDEPRRYAASSDVTVYIQPGSAHWHFQSTHRHEFWIAVHNWIWSRSRFRDGRRPNTAPHD